MPDFPDTDSRPSSEAAQAWPTWLDLAFCLAIPFLIPLGFLFAVAALLLRLRNLRRARNRCARNYWRCSVVAHLLFAYAVAVLTLLACDSMTDEAWQMTYRWPSLAGWLGIAGEVQFALLLDVAGALSAALVALGVAHCFGHVDDANVWHPPRRLQRGARRGVHPETWPEDGPA